MVQEGKREGGWSLEAVGDADLVSGKVVIVRTDRLVGSVNGEKQSLKRALLY